MNAVTIKSNPRRPAIKAKNFLGSPLGYPVPCGAVPALHIVYLNGVRMDAFLSLPRAEALAKQLSGE